MKPNIIFLDFDGPLFPYKVIRFNPRNKLHHKVFSYWVMDPMIVEFLNSNANDFQIVVSSSWNEVHTKEEIETLFRMNNLILRLHDVWKTIPIGTRGQNIQSWISSNSGMFNDFIIIDDPMSCDNIEDYFDDSRLIIVDPVEGFSYTDYEKLESMIKEVRNEG